jgi:hypothetical protein
MLELPITPDKVWEKLQQVKTPATAEYVQAGAVAK